MSGLQSLSRSWYYAFGLHISEPQVSIPRMTSTQVFVLFLWLYTMVLTISYSTNLTAFLLVSKSPHTIDTIRELHDSGLRVAGMGQFYKKELAMAIDPYLKVSDILYLTSQHFVLIKRMYCITSHSLVESSQSSKVFIFCCYVKNVLKKGEF